MSFLSGRPGYIKRVKIVVGRMNFEKYKTFDLLLLK